MKGKIFKNCVVAICISLGLCVSLISCDGDEDIGVNSYKIENYLYGKRWTFREAFMNFNKTKYSFFRNHLVMSFSSSDKLESGMLTYGPSYFFGTWHTAGDKLLTTFTSGSYWQPGMENLLGGTLAVTELASDGLTVTCTDSAGTTYYFEHMNGIGAGETSFTDYTDASSHDGALHGTWEMTGYKGGTTPVDFTLIKSARNPRGLQPRWMNCH